MFIYQFCCLLTVWYTWLLKNQIEDPTVSQKMNQVKAIASSFFVAYLYLKTIEAYVGIGLNLPVTCWITNDNDSYWDDILDCWLIVVIPIMMLNLRSLMTVEEGLVS